MKLFWLVFSLNLIAINLVGQGNSIIQFEGGLGMNNTAAFKSEFAQGLNANAAIWFQHRSFQLGVRHERTFATFGTEGPHKYRRSSRPPWYIRDKTSEFAKFNSTQLMIGYHPNFKHFKPIIGVGLSYNRFTIKERFYNDDLVPIMNPFSTREDLSRSYYSMIYQIGYKVKNIRYSVFLTPNYKNEHDKILGTSIAYNFGLSKKESPSKYLFDSHHHWKSNPVMCRIEFGRSLIVPMERNHAASARYFINAQIALKRNSYVGVAYEAKGRSMGKDENTIRVLDFDDVGQLYVRNTSISVTIHSFKGYFQKVENFSSNIDYLYGAGVGLYKIDQVGEVIAWQRYFPAEIEKSRNVGLYMFTGFRTGIYSNKIEFNIPFGKIPPYVGLQIAVGLQWRRRAS